MNPADLVSMISKLTQDKDLV